MIPRFGAVELSIVAAPSAPMTSMADLVLATGDGSEKAPVPLPLTAATWNWYDVALSRLVMVARRVDGSSGETEACCGGGWWAERGRRGSVMANGLVELQRHAILTLPVVALPAERQTISYDVTPSISAKGQVHAIANDVSLASITRTACAALGVYCAGIVRGAETIELGPSRPPPLLFTVNT